MPDSAPWQGPQKTRRTQPTAGRKQGPQQRKQKCKGCRNRQWNRAQRFGEADTPGCLCHVRPQTPSCPSSPGQPKGYPFAKAIGEVLVQGRWESGETGERGAVKVEATAMEREDPQIRGQVAVLSHQKQGGCNYHNYWQGRSSGWDGTTGRVTETVSRTWHLQQQARWAASKITADSILSKETKTR